MDAMDAASCPYVLSATTAVLTQALLDEIRTRVNTVSFLTMSDISSLVEAPPDLSSRPLLVFCYFCHFFGERLVRKIMVPENTFHNDIVLHPLVFLSRAQQTYNLTRFSKKILRSSLLNIPVVYRGDYMPTSQTGLISAIIECFDLCCRHVSMITNEKLVHILCCWDPFFCPSTVCDRLSLVRTLLKLEFTATIAKAMIVDVSSVLDDMNEGKRVKSLAVHLENVSRYISKMCLDS
jgi:hypothetical protein